MPFKSLLDADNVMLCEGFDPQEIKDAVWACAGDKCPGPDGYNFFFIKSPFGSLW